MQNNKVLDLTLAEVRKLIKRDQDHGGTSFLSWFRHKRFISDDNLRGKSQLAVYKESIEMCKQCEVRSECLAFAVNLMQWMRVWEV